MAKAQRQRQKSQEQFKPKSSLSTKEEIFEIAFDQWLTDYRIMAWEGLTTDEMRCLCDYHRKNLLKEIKDCEKL